MITSRVSCLLVYDTVEWSVHHRSWLIEASPANTKRQLIVIYAVQYDLGQEAYTKEGRDLSQSEVNRHHSGTWPPSRAYANKLSQLHPG